MGLAGVLWAWEKQMGFGINRACVQRLVFGYDPPRETYWVVDFGMILGSRCRELILHRLIWGFPLRFVRSIRINSYRFFFDLSQTCDSDLSVVRSVGRNTQGGRAE